MPFLPPNQQRQSTEGSAALKALWVKLLEMFVTLLSRKYTISIG